MAHKPEIIKLPTALVSRGDSVFLGRELELLNDKLTQASHQSNDAVKLPRLSRVLEELAEQNNLDLRQPDVRQRLLKFLKDLKGQAPVIHISFATEPSSKVITRLISWLRAEVHPLILLNVGLQPSIAAGCVVRTNSKYFDFSMRQHLSNHRAELVERLKVVS